MMHLLRNLDIGQRILLIFAVPMLLVILSLGYRITSGYMDDARYALDTRGLHMARQLAALCEFGLYAKDAAELRRQAGSVTHEDDVVAVRIADAGGRILVQAGIADLPDDIVKYASYTASVTRTGIDISDFETESSLTDAGNLQDQVLGQVTVTLSTSSLLENLRNTLLSGIILTISGLLASILLAYLVARSISVPIRHLTAVVGRLTGGDLSARARQSSPGELGSLETGINQMANSLQNAQNKLTREVREATAALQHTVTELENRNIELDQARDRAVRAAAAKTDFLARMSHEIRTPLNAIIGFNDLLDKTSLNENQHEYSRTISQAASQLLLVIEDILGYTQLESGAVKLDPAPFNLHDCTENVVSMLSASAHRKQLELVLYIHSDVPRFIVSDRKRVSQVLTNLAANAIKFTEQGHVVVEVSLDGPVSESVTVRIAVTDTGIGLSDTQIGQIFSPFVQADVSTSRKYGGTGLGLSISKKLVEQLGGEIRVESAPGAGSVFSFTLTSPRLDDDSGMRANVLAGKTVLVYDRNPFSLRALRNRFFTWGATVFNTSDPDRLRQMLAAREAGDRPCDLLVAGIPGPEFSGNSCADLCTRYASPVSIPRLFLVSAELDEPAPDSNCRKDCRILPKPARSDLLLRTTRALLKLPGIPEDTPAGPARPAAVHIRSGLNVLLVEDNRFNQDLLRRMLDMLGVRSTLADDGNEACLHADAERYDLIFMDIHMPVMGGIEATHRIRQGVNRDTPIIALTADIFTGQQQDLAREGFDDCLHKPVSEQHLAGMLQKWGQPGAHDDAARAPGAAASGAPAADLTLDGIGFPPEFHRRLHRELETRLQALRTAWSDGNEDAVQGEMHQLKGVVDYFRLDEFHAAFRTLQTALQSREGPRVTHAIDTLQQLLAERKTD